MFEHEIRLSFTREKKLKYANRHCDSFKKKENKVCSIISDP